MSLTFENDLPSTEELINRLMLTIQVAWANQLSRQDIQLWLSNFTGAALKSAEKERNIAIWLLYNFVYYNESEIKHLCKFMLKKYIHNELKLINKDITINEINEIMQKSKFLSIGTTSESGAYILYLFRQENELPISFFNDQTNTANSTANIVFVDDMTLSGDQAAIRINEFRYCGSLFIQNDIRTDFIQRLIDGSDNSLESYIREKINKVIPINEDAKKNINDKFVCALNDYIIMNKEFYSDTEKYFESITLSEPTIVLLEDLKQNKLCRIGIYKANRLLLQDYFNELGKSLNNFINNNLFLLSFFASTDAINQLTKIGVTVLSCITLDEESKLFSDKSMVFAQYPKVQNVCKIMCQHYGNMLCPENPLGYKEGSYSFGLYYNIPDNSLPIFWANSNWNPIFARHQKNYGGLKDVFGRFI